MSQPLVACPFGDDTTIRWSTRAGEYLLWVAASSVLTADRESSWTIADFWQMRDRDFVTITNRWPDVPGWFTLRPLEVAMRAGFRAAVGLGVPRVFSENWGFGA